MNRDRFVTISLAFQVGPDFGAAENCPAATDCGGVSEDCNGPTCAGGSFERLGFEARILVDRERLDALRRELVETLRRTVG